MVVGWTDSSTDKNSWFSFDSSNRARSRSQNGRSRSLFGRSSADQLSFDSYDSYLGTSDRGGFPRIPSLRRNKNEEEVGISEQLSSFASIVMEEVQALMETNYSSSDSDSEDESETEYSSDSEYEKNKQRRELQGRRGIARNRSQPWSRRNKNNGSNQVARPSSSHKQTAPYARDAQGIKESQGLSQTRSPLWRRRKKDQHENDAEREQVINYSSLRPSGGSAFEVILDNPEQEKPSPKKLSKKKIWRKMSFSRGRSSGDQQEEERQPTEERPGGISRQFRWSFPGDEEDEIIASRVPAFPGDRSTGNNSDSSVEGSERAAFLDDSSRSIASSVEELISDLDSSFFGWFKESEKNSAFHTMFPDMLHSMSDLSSEAEQSAEASVEQRIAQSNADFFVNLKLKEEEERFVTTPNLEEADKRYMADDTQAITNPIVGNRSVKPDDMEDIVEILGQMGDEHSDQEDSGPGERTLRRSSSNLVFGESVRSLFQKKPSEFGFARSGKKTREDILPTDTDRETPKKSQSRSAFLRRFQRQRSGNKETTTRAMDKVVPVATSSPQSWTRHSPEQPICNTSAQAPSAFDPVKIEPIVVRRTGSNASVELSFGDAVQQYVGTMTTNNAVEKEPSKTGFWRRTRASFGRSRSLGNGLGRLTCPSGTMYRPMELDEDSAR